jgi:hypothetical protein
MRSSTMLELPSRSVRDYLAQFGVAAIWVTSSTADQIIMAIGEQHPATVEQAAAEILAAAARLDVVLSEHATVMARAKAAVVELERRLVAAQASGALQAFNVQYRKRGWRRMRPASAS